MDKQKAAVFAAHTLSQFKDLRIRPEERKQRKEKKTEKNEVEGQARRERKQQRCLRQRRYCIIGMTCELKGLKVLPRVGP